MQNQISTQDPLASLVFITVWTHHDMPVITNDGSCEFNRTQYGLKCMAHMHIVRAFLTIYTHHNLSVDYIFHY